MMDHESKTADQLLEAVRGGDVRLLARTITEIENGSRQVIPLLKSLYPLTGRSLVIGVTGSPGSGKSTLTDCLAGAFRQQGRKVGIVAVDPSSPFSGGAILGDRIRMQSRSTDSGTFIRSMATRGRLGGLAANTHDVVLLLDAAGYETILVETVGVGQDELDIVRVADLCVLVLVPGMGDDVQTIKAGLMEIGDILVINKSDRRGVEKLEEELNAALTLGEREGGWVPPIVRTVAVQNAGVEELVDKIEKFAAHSRASPDATRRRRIKAFEQKLIHLLSDRLLQRALGEISDDELHHVAERVLERETDPYTAVEEIVRRTTKK